MSKKLGRIYREEDETMNHDVQRQYYDILKLCKFISKEDTWFIEGTEVKFVGNDIFILWGEYNNEDVLFNDNLSLFEGLTNFNCKENESAHIDQESCSFEEFKIMYKDMNISEMSLKDFKSLTKYQK